MAGNLGLIQPPAAHSSPPPLPLLGGGCAAITELVRNLKDSQSPQARSRRGAARRDPGAGPEARRWSSGSLDGSCGAPHPTPQRPRRRSCRQLLGGGERPCRKGAGSRVCRGLDCGRAEWRRRWSGRRWRSHPAWRRGREHLLGMSSGLCQPSRVAGPLFPTVLPGTVVVSLSSAAHETLVFVFNVTVARTWASSPRSRAPVPQAEFAALLTFRDS